MNTGGNLSHWKISILNTLHTRDYTLHRERVDFLHLFQ